MLLVAGSNSHGQLGTGNVEDIHTFTPITLPSDVEVKKIVTGSNHTLLQTTSNQVLVAGNNSACQLGSSKDATILNFQPIEVPIYDPIVDVACGWEHTYFLTEKEKSFGSDGSRHFIPLADGEKLMAIWCGLSHAFVKTSYGKIYAWGKNRNGQLSLDPGSIGGLETNVKSPTLVHSRDSIVDIACGQFHSLFLLSDGTVVGSGRGKHGQISSVGLRPNERERIVKIRCGWSHSATLSSHGIIRVFGQNTFGQLGSTDVSQREFEWPGKFIDVVCGSAHTIGVTEDGLVYFSGWNEHGTAGLGHTDQIVTLTTVPVAGVKRIFAGCATVFIATK